MITSTSINSDEKLRYQLDLQARQIDAVLDHHQVEGSVTSGTVQRRIVEFDVQAPLSAGLERVRGLKDNMMAALGVRDVAIAKRDGRWRLQVERAYNPPVPLATLLASLEDLSPGAAAIGLSDTDQPVLLQFGPDDVHHVLVAGDSGAGKTTLLRTMAVSMALTSRQSDVQLLLIDGGEEDEGTESGAASSWRPLAYLPHLMTDLVAGPDISAEVLHFLAGEMAYRRKQRVRLPRIIVLIDNAVALLAVGGQAVANDILRLLQHGSDTGIHLVLATSRPDSDTLDALFMSNLPVRLVGKVADPTRSKKVVGSADIQAEYLRGDGEFIVLADGQQRYFQAADMGDYDLHWELNCLLAAPRPRLLARPYETRPAIATPEPIPFAAQPFKRENGVQWTTDSATARSPTRTVAPRATSAKSEDSDGGLS